MNEAQTFETTTDQRVNIGKLLAHIEKDLIETINQYREEVKIRVEGYFSQLNKLMNCEQIK